VTFFITSTGSEAAVRLDKEKAGRTAKRYEARAKKTHARKEKERLLITADAFWLIEAALSEKPAFMRTKSKRQAPRN
jgi:hypothetical protein